MANIVFYEKPGCINNSKQKKMLTDAGHQVDNRNLLTAPWSRAALLKYFSSMAVSKWFNSSAPDIKSGKIKPSALNEVQALQLMIENPILIRRPLMCVADEYRVGFNIDSVNQWIGLANINLNEDLETCQQASGHSCDLAEDSQPVNGMADIKSVVLSNDQCN